MNCGGGFNSFETPHRASDLLIVRSDVYSVRGMSAVNKSVEDGGSFFSSKVINTVFIILLLDLLGFTLILPLLPSILDHYAQTGDVAYQWLQSVVEWFREAVGVPLEKKYNSVLFGGLIGSLFSLLQFLSSPVTGALSDQHGRRPLLLLTTLGLMSSYAVWAVSRSFSMFLLFRVIGGVCKGNVSLCTAIMADLPCPKARNRGMKHRQCLLPNSSSACLGLQCCRSALHLAHVARNTQQGRQGFLFWVWGLLGSPEPISSVPVFSCNQNRRFTFKRTNAETQSFGSGLLLLPFPVFRSGVHVEFSDSPTFPLYWHAAGEDVLLHWDHHGIDPGGLRSQNQTWAAAESCSYGHHNVDSSVYSHWAVTQCNNAVHWLGIIFFRGCSRGSVSLSAGL
ncbi:uncharacterized protein ACBR49_020536 isoform 3-T3 [Aulostomus maculatus]